VCGAHPHVRGCRAHFVQQSFPYKTSMVEGATREVKFLFIYLFLTKYLSILFIKNHEYKVLQSHSHMF
jgi:hypothetical protein